MKQLKPGKTGTATFTLRRKDVSTWRVVEQRWQQASKIEIGVGAHSRDLNLVSWYRKHNEVLLTDLLQKQTLSF